MEVFVAQIWSKVLTLEESSLNRTSSFTELGGHSLSAIKVQGLLKAALGLSDLPLKVLFANPQLCDLAGALERLGAKAVNGAVDDHFDATSSAVEATMQAWEESRFDPFPLTPIQQAYFIGRDPLVELGGVATHAYQEFAIPSWLTSDLLGQVISELLARHDALRIIFEQDSVSGVLQQRVLPYAETGSYEVLHADVSDEDEEVGEQMIESVRSELSHQVLDPHTWPLFDVRITKTKELNVLHISLDALIVDFYSSAILAADTLALINAARQANSSSLASVAQLHPLKATFRQMVLEEMQLRTDDSAGMARSRSYWQGRADNIPNAPELPLAKRPSEVKVSLFEREEVIISKERFASLEMLARRHKVTPTTVIAYAFAQALSKYAATARFIINLTVFQRPLDIVDADQVVGDFTSSLLLEYDGQDARSTKHALQQLDAQLIDDLSHASYSGIDMIRHLRSKNGASHQVAFPVVMTS
ncbi:hypothetical protein, partial [Sporisorium scitamineum]